MPAYEIKINCYIFFNFKLASRFFLSKIKVIVCVLIKFLLQDCQEIILSETKGN